MPDVSLPLVLVVALFLTLLLSFGRSDKTSESDDRSRGWQKNRKKRSKKARKAPAAHRKKSMVIASEESSVEVPLSDVEAPASPLLQISPDPFGECCLQGFETQEIESGDHSDTESDTCPEEIHVDVVDMETCSVTNELDDITSEGHNCDGVEYHSHISSELRLPPGLTLEDSGSDNEAEHSGKACSKSLLYDSMTSVAERDNESERTCEACSNVNTSSWGCATHRTYTSALLLAHRELRIGAAQMPVDMNLRLVRRN